MFDLLLIAFAVARGLWRTGNPGRYFGEGRFVTGLSCLQLLGVAVLAFLTHRARRKAPLEAGPEAAAAGHRVIWLLVSLGFVFLACDEVFEIHENLDRIIHRVFGITQTSLTDRLDDLIIALYGLAGLAAMWICRRELLPFRHVMFRPLAAGFVIMGLSVACDTISGDDTALSAVISDQETVKRVNPWFSAGDGAFTILAEGMFVAAFHAAWLQAKSRRHTAVAGAQAEAADAAPLSAETLWKA